MAFTLTVTFSVLDFIFELEYYAMVFKCDFLLVDGER